MFEHPEAVGIATTCIIKIWWIQRPCRTSIGKVEERDGEEENHHFSKTNMLASLLPVVASSFMENRALPLRAPPKTRNKG